MRRLLLSCLASFAAPGLAQTTPQVVRAAPVDFDKIEIRTTRLADDLFTLEGHGGRITILTGVDGVFMVDSQFAPLTDKIVKAIRKITDQPIRYLVNTHVHADHTGGNENIAKLGALLLSRDQLRCRLEQPSPGPDGRPPPPAPAAALPVVTYDGPVTLHINGEDVQLIPIRAAHTDGDTLIRFVKHDALAVGDYYRSVQYPFVDIFNGGSLEGLLAALGETIGLSGPDTKIIPGHGPLVKRNAVIAQRDLVLALRDRMRPLIAKGLTVEQVLAARLTAGTDARIPDGAQTSERFIRWMYAELTQPQVVRACRAAE